MLVIEKTERESGIHTVKPTATTNLENKKEYIWIFYIQKNRRLKRTCVWYFLIDELLEELTTSGFGSCK